MKNIETGHIDLFDIYKYVATHPNYVSGKNGDMLSYTKLVNEVVKPIPKDKPGWYLWGRFNDVGFWEIVYLGKAGNKKTSSLYARIREELLDERAAFWATIYGSEPTERQFQKIYKNKYGPGTRSYRKKNIHFIIWLSLSPISEEEIKREESVLISIYRPAINIQRITYPPKSDITDQVVQAIDSEINRIARV
jgi:hypothetical protein